jgi:hypothetical protein
MNVPLNAPSSCVKPDCMVTSEEMRCLRETQSHLVPPILLHTHKNYLDIPSQKFQEQFKFKSAPELTQLT